MIRTKLSISIATITLLAATGLIASAPTGVSASEVIASAAGRKMPTAPANWEPRETHPEPIEPLSIPRYQAEPITFSKVSFSCQLEGGQYVTKVQDVQVTYNPAQVPAYQEQALNQPTNTIIWKTSLASDHPEGLYEPEGRCQAVSAHLTNLASALGVTSSVELPSRMASISQVGMVNNQKVIFPAYEGASASDDNVMFTLNPANATHSSDVLAQFQIGISPNTGGEVPANLMPPVIE